MDAPLPIVTALSTGIRGLDQISGGGLTAHRERTIREFRLDGSDGIRSGKPLCQFHGVLTGVPSYVGHLSQLFATATAPP